MEFCNKALAKETVSFQLSADTEDGEQVKTFDELKKWKERAMSSPLRQQQLVARSSIVEPMPEPQTTKHEPRLATHNVTSLVLKDPPRLSLETLIQESASVAAPQQLVAKDQQVDRLKNAFERALQNSVINTKPPLPPTVVPSPVPIPIERIEAQFQVADSTDSAVIIEKPTTPVEKSNDEKRKSGLAAVGNALASLFGAKNSAKKTEQDEQSPPVTVTTPQVSMEKKPKLMDDTIKSYLQTLLPTKIADMFGALAKAEQQQLKTKKHANYYHENSVNISSQDELAILKGNYSESTGAALLAKSMVDVIRHYPDPLISKEFRSALQGTKNISQDFVKKQLSKTPLKLALWNSIVSHVQSIQDVDSKMAGDATKEYAVAMLGDHDATLVAKLVQLVRACAVSSNKDESEDDEDDNDIAIPAPRLALSVPKISQQSKPAPSALSKLKAKNYIDSDDEDDDFSPAVNISNKLKQNDYDPHDF